MGQKRHPARRAVADGPNAEFSSTERPTIAQAVTERTRSARPSNRSPTSRRHAARPASLQRSRAPVRYASPQESAQDGGPRLPSGPPTERTPDAPAPPDRRRSDRRRAGLRLRDRRGWRPELPRGRPPPPAGLHGAPGRVGTGLATASTRVGTVVTSGGLTLYTFDGDTRKPAASHCADACATTWPPVLGDGQPALVGVDPRLVATAGRPDGTQQLTLAGRPLYLFSGDAAPGDVGGDGKDGRWHAVAPDGRPAGG